MGKLYSNESEFAYAKKVDKTCKYNTEWKKPDTKVTQYDSVYIMTKKQAESINGDRY